MSNSDEKSYMDNDKLVYSRFNSDEIVDQKDEIVVYILTELTDDSLDSIEKSIRDIKFITGYELSIESAMFIRRLAKRLKMVKAEESHALKKCRNFI